MADTFKNLGQVDPSAATLTSGYTVPGGTAAILSGITVCNRSATPTAFRVAHVLSGASADNKQYIAYDHPIAGNESLVVPGSSGKGLADGDEIKVYATLATLSFNIDGMEVS